MEAVLPTVLLPWLVGLPDLASMLTAPANMWAHLTSILALSLTAVAVPSATARNGTYAGVYSEQYDQDFFLGVPFAQPPVGELRFRNPEPLNTTWDGSRVADAYSPLCVGYGLDQIPYNQSEDCLYLNVVRPAGYEDVKLPIGFWIHGGGFSNGGGGDGRYNLSFIVQQSVKIGKPFIGVSTNYRLSAWGFLSSSELAGEGLTNLGLKDQRLALHWVQENIEGFGGDPTKVTIWGESAGAASVGFQLTAYGGRDDSLFRAAIMESGNPVFYTKENAAADYQSLYNNIVSGVNCSDSWDKVQCLREAPFDLLNRTINGTTFQPVVDGDFVQRYGSVQLSRGEFVPVPIITGANSDEGASFSAQGMDTTADFRATLAALPAGFQDAVLAAYPDDPAVNVVASLGDQRPGPPYGAQWRRSASYWGDYYFIAARRHTAATWAAAGVPAYAFRFNAIPAGVAPEVGAGHYKEIGYVFRNLDGVGYRPDIRPFVNRTAGHFELADLMSSTWASFIYDLDPNGYTGRPDGMDAWTPYDVADPLDFVFDANVTSYLEPDTYRKEGMALINDNAQGIYNR